MAKLSYWERRQAEDMVMYIQSADDTADEIARFYMAAADYLSYQTDEVFEKYRSKHGLSETDAIQLLNTMQDQSSINELLAKLKESNSNEEQKELIKVLEAPAYQSRIEHFQELNHQLDQVMERVYHQEVKANTSHYAELAPDAYYRSTYTIQKGTGTAYSFSVIDAEAIEKLIQSNWSGKNYSERIWKNTDTLVQDLKAEIMLHFITGKTNQEIVKVIQEKFAVGANVARRLIWTETSYVAGEMNAKAYEEAGIERYRFCAVLDLSTSEVCRNLDGQLFKLSERKVGVNYPPMHPYCRSTTIAVISDEALAKLKRSSRDPVTHKPMTVPDNMTYKEWYNRYVKSKPEALLEEKKIKNRSSDRAQWKKYQKILDDNIPDTLDKFQDMKYNEAEKWKYSKMDYKRRSELLNHPELKLPNANHPNVPDGKFTDYLLGGNNEVGLAKGRAITARLGYDIHSWMDFKQEIALGAGRYPAISKGLNAYGAKYEQKMVIYGKKGTPANVIVGWLHKPDGTINMTSAYIKEVNSEWK